MISLQIIHASEFLTGHWHTVEMVADRSLDDYLASPSFEWVKGTMVRALHPDQRSAVFCGIFNDHECVDVSYGSKRMNSDTFYQGSMTCSRLSWPETWARSSNGAEMMGALGRFMSTKVVLERAYELITPAAPRLRGQSLFAYHALGQWLLGKVHQTELEDRIDGVGRTPGMDAHSLYMLLRIANHNERAPQISSAIDMMAQFVGGQNHTSAAYILNNYANDLRKNVPFYDIAINLVA